MNLLTLPFRLPFLPIEAILKLGEVIEEEAERQLHDPARIRRELEEAQRQRDSGEISDEELADIQDRLTQIMVQVPAPPSVTRSGNDQVE